MTEYSLKFLLDFYISNFMEFIRFDIPMYRTEIRDYYIYSKENDDGTYNFYLGYLEHETGRMMYNIALYSDGYLGYVEPESDKEFQFDMMDICTGKCYDITFTDALHIIELRKALNIELVKNVEAAKGM